MSSKQYLTMDYLRQCFRYADGKLFWKKRPLSHFKNQHGMNIWNAKYAGKEAGNESGEIKWRRWMVRINRQSFYRYHVIWALFHERWPTALIDHKNHNGLDDVISNLREATHLQNTVNSRLSCKNTSGFKGVSYKSDRDKWRARIRVKGKETTLGYYTTKEEAYSVYCEAAKSNFGAFACLG